MNRGHDGARRKTNKSDGRCGVGFAEKSVCRVKNQHKLKSPCVDWRKIDFIRLEPADFSSVYRIFRIGRSMRGRVL